MPASRFASVLRALVSHWRRNPVQLAALLGGLAIATALWSAVQALNAEARASYDRAAETVAGGPERLVAAAAGPIDPALWPQLRRAGWPVSPVVERRVTIGGERLTLLGLDLFSLPPDAGVALLPGAGTAPATPPPLAAFLTPPYASLITPETAERLGLAEGDPLTADGAPPLPPALPLEGLSDGVIMVDIAAALAWRPDPEPVGLSHFLLGASDAPRTPLAEASGGAVVRAAPAETADLDRLTESFHLNLTAFGLLAFLVGLFIVHGAIGLAFEQRRAMLRTLRSMGVSARAVTLALLAEVALIALVAGGAGLVGGYFVAGALLPDVAASIRGLYGAEVAGSLSIRPAWWLAGLTMALAGALAAAAQSLWRAYTMPVLAGALPEAWAAAARRGIIRQGALGLALAVATLAVLAVGHGLIAGFASMAGLLVAAALLLPVCLAAILVAAERRSPPGLRRWFWSDSRQQLPGLSLALMALLLALAVNIGVGTMVSSFRATFYTWLEDRLAASAYLQAPSEAAAREITGWLTADPRVEAVLPNWHVDSRLRGWPIEVYGFTDDPLYRERWPLISSLPEAWDLTAAGQAAMVSEQLSYRFGLGPGDTITLEAETGPQRLIVAAVYPDYGNPRGQVRVTTDLLTAGWPGVERRTFGLRIAEGETEGVIDDLRERYGLGLDRLRDNVSLQALSRSIFERTFVVTGALNTLTLGVAAIALFTALVTLAELRLPSLAPVWAIGLTRRRLAAIELLRMLSLALVTALLAVPLGLAVAWLLLAVINVEAFGWRLPLHAFPGDWALLVGLAVLSAGLAALVPVLRLMRIAPVRLIAVFASAR